MTISCTLVLIPSAKTGLQSWTFPDLKILSPYISNRAGINSILIGSLLVLLHQAIAMDSYDPDCFSELIMGDHCIHESIQIATTCVLTFGIKLQEPVHGF